MEMNRLIRKLVRKHKTNCPFSLAAALKIEVWFCDLGGSTRGFFRRSMRRKYIVIHEELSEEWRRFVCAHELAHALLHPGMSRFWMDEHSFFCAGRYEREAHEFAVHLLTTGDFPQPDESIQDFLRRNHVPLEMAAYY